MRHQSLLAVFSLLSILSFGCSSSDSGGGNPGDGGTDTSGSGPTADQACTDLASAYCDKVASCTPTYMQLGYGDATECKAQFKANCLAGIAAPSTGTSPQNVSDCAKAAPAVACNDLFANRVPAACQPVAGKLADGAACGDDSQCTSKYCGTSDKTVCGTCGPAPAAGGSCATQKCGPGTTCAGTTCVVPGKSGDACSATAPCEIQLSCTDGKCGAYATNVGDACSLDGKGQPLCDFITKGLFCLTGKCVQAKLNPVGGACGYDATTKEVSGCVAQGYCKKAKPDDLAGTCVAAAADGAACDPVNGPNCATSSKCVSGTCKKPDPSTCK